MQIGLCASAKAGTLHDYGSRHAVFHSTLEAKSRPSEIVRGLRRFAIA
jgi:hypothetical protein